MAVANAAAAQVAQIAGAVGGGGLVDMCNLYVAGLPVNSGEDVIRKLFSRYGQVLSIRILPRYADSSPETTCLVRMGSAEEAASTISALNGQIPAFEGVAPVLHLSFSLQGPTEQLFVQGLPVGIDENGVRQTFASCGQIQQMQILPPAGMPLPGAGPASCSALVRMSTVEQARQAVGFLNGQVASAAMMPLRVMIAKSPK